MATGRMLRMPITVRHLPETSSTTSTKLTTVTVIDANPIITRSDMNMATDVEKAKIPPATENRAENAGEVVMVLAKKGGRGLKGVAECQWQGRTRK